MFYQILIEFEDKVYQFNNEGNSMGLEERDFEYYNYD